MSDTFAEHIDMRLRESYVEIYLHRVVGLPGCTVRIEPAPEADCLEARIDQQLGATEVHGRYLLPHGAGRLHPADLANIIVSWLDPVFRPWLYPDQLLGDLWDRWPLFPRLDRAELWWGRRRARRQWKRLAHRR